MDDVGMQVRRSGGFIYWGMRDFLPSETIGEEGFVGWQWGWVAFYTRNHLTSHIECAWEGL